MTNKLKIGVLIDDTRLEHYKVEILKEIQKLDSCKIVKFIKRVKESDLDKKDSKYLFYRVFNKVDAKLFGRGTKYLNLKSIDSIINSISSEESPDVIINLSASNKHYPNDVKYGVWQFVYSSNPIGYWEVLQNNPYTEVTLQKSGIGFESGLLLSKFRTRTDQKSMLKNRDLISWRSHMMMVRELKKLAEFGEEYFNDKQTTLNFNLKQLESNRKKFDPQFAFSDKLHKNPPTNGEMLIATCKLLKKYVTFSLKRFITMDRWLILYSQTRNGEINPNLGEYKRFYAPSQNYFCADPFVVDEDDKSYLFYEELDYSRFKGYIKVSEYKNGAFKESEIILEEEYHLSYPNVFKHDGKYYMVPESYENKTVDLFEAVEFPTKWKKKKTLLDDIRAVDATFTHHDNKWWMFVNVVEKDDFSTDDELHIYFTDDIVTGQWIPHKQNPVVCDVTCARPAGNLIKKDGKLYRPAQDCSGIYGRKMVINEIDILNENEFKEHIVSDINTDFADDLTGIHTINSSKNITVIDAIKSR
jgi:hypothetical protein